VSSTTSSSGSCTSPPHGHDVSSVASVRDSDDQPLSMPSMLTPDLHSVSIYSRRVRYCVETIAVGAGFIGALLHRALRDQGGAPRRSAGGPRWGPAFRALRALHAPHRTPPEVRSSTNAPTQAAGTSRSSPRPTRRRGQPPEQRPRQRRTRHRLLHPRHGGPDRRRHHGHERHDRQLVTPGTRRCGSLWRRPQRRFILALPTTRVPHQRDLAPTKTTLPGRGRTASRLALHRPRSHGHLVPRRSTRLGHHRAADPTRQHPAELRASQAPAPSAVPVHTPCACSPGCDEVGGLTASTPRLLAPLWVGGSLCQASREAPWGCRSC